MALNVWSLVPRRVRIGCPKVEYCLQFSDERLRKINSRLSPVLGAQGKKFVIVVAGSLGRKEAHDTSDVDAFVLKCGLTRPKDQSKAEKLLSNLSNVIRMEDVGLRMASAGAFSNVASLEDLVRNIGGKRETNDILTRRMVLLVEGRGLGRTQLFNQAKRRILLTYLRDLQPVRDRRPIFLINDLIRYYRTICVDHEYKKNEAGKPWAVRLTKLRHSRKVFYFSALLPLLESMFVNSQERLRWIQSQFLDFTPLERVILFLHKYGKRRHWDLLTHYNTFLEFMASKERREELDCISFDRRDKHRAYVRMRDNAREFRSLFVDFVASVRHWRDPIEKYVLC
jgi:predicted nucleotidyltransferase